MDRPDVNYVLMRGVSNSLIGKGDHAQDNQQNSDECNWLHTLPSKWALSRFSAREGSVLRVVLSWMGYALRNKWPINVKTKRIRKIKNNSFAIPAAARA